MRYILTFKTSFPESSEYKHPRGYSICEFLGKELERTGFSVKTPENYRDIAWSIDCDVDSQKVFFFVGFLGTKATDWQLIICTNIGIIGRILGRKDDEARSKLVKAIHKILSRDRRFSDIKWFSKYTGSPKDVWSAGPESANSVTF